MIVIGYILLFVGLIVGFVGETMLLTVAYRRGLGYLFACLFLPLFAWIFLLLNARHTAVPFTLAIVGLVVSGLGIHIMGLFT